MTWKHQDSIDQKEFEELWYAAKEHVQQEVSPEHIQLISQYLYYKSSLFDRRDSSRGITPAMVVIEASNTARNRASPAAATASITGCPWAMRWLMK